jgi:ataxia telangiectasia mutated family protein
MSFQAYSSIGIKEAAHIFVHPMKSRPRYLQMQGDLERILHEMSAQLTQENDVENCQRVLMDAGLFGLASKLPSAIPQYESCWRLGDWSILIEKDLEFDANSKVSDFQREFERCHYTALKCLNNRDELGTETSLMKARRAVVQLLSRSSLECTKNLYKFMALCQQLQQIEDFAKVSLIFLGKRGKF